MDRHLLVCLSAHGYGHAAQTAPVINALRCRVPDLHVTLRTTLPHGYLGSKFVGDFDVISEASDVGMLMESALDALVYETGLAYRRLHEDWDARVAREAETLTKLAPDLVLANAPYLPLAGARAASLSACALCSLNWADIYAHYFRGRPEAGVVHRQILDAYAAGAAFLQPAPCMPMKDLPNRRSVGPIAEVGHDRRRELRARLGLAAGVRLVMISYGGSRLRLPVEDWPRSAGFHWIVPGSWQASAPQIVAFEDLGMPFIDVLRSCDALVGKPGYGTFAEAACNGTPMLYVRRDSWPEDDYLIKWLSGRGRCLEVGRHDLARGALSDSLHALWAMPRRRAVEPTGGEAAAAFLARMLMPGQASSGRGAVNEGETVVGG